MPSTVDIQAILSLHHQSIITWKESGISLQHSDLHQLIEENHAFNYQLWHAEDKARRDDMGYEFVYHAKREIDFYNQQRNNRMESMDEWLFKQLKPESPANCPINSESPGMMIDRLSILSLKLYHMEIQAHRVDSNEEHKKKCTIKMDTIQQQLEQLALCLEQLLLEVANKTRSFRIYHQFKMYNDPMLNPELYTHN
ncbi:MAG: DUF4254 domain-containing protein [Legionella sp.]|nr:DUF4254 domain-containing protein [Legionella sp.]